ncbi:PP2C family protein-serine/threonine phosphatase [Noviherbaspirillum denitrificans]|uniref:Serine/threonine protein phosphatase n=1 Tax=Noviherbaspirillum denitrificans TaxID=1968433 RepID=A0A254TNZ2_9BURK|nr:protein phosphatase 2C domain-containing protein [Noviherbaspirillum denitrificans]OWW21428.1 serine/threonine protein phosphatase [Noviherbaspirillum denitrificans]
MTQTTPFKWTSSSRTHTGLVRKINEDSVLDLADRGIWAVADGMGGHTLGDFASNAIVASLSDLQPGDALELFATDAEARLQSVNRQLRAEAHNRGAQIIGSTVVVLLAHGRRCAYLWAGDSRIYLCRNGHLMQLTRDHSQVEELLACGSLTAEDAIHHPARNLITRAVGAAETLEVDGEMIEVADGDIFLLCSDGVSNEVSEQEIRAALVTGNCPQAADELVEIALMRGGRDNISAVVARADDLHTSDKTVLNPAL